MLATAVAMPLVGWLVGRMGHKRLYLGSLSLFNHWLRTVRPGVEL